MATPVPTLVGVITETASDGTILIPNTTAPAVGDYLVAFVAAYASGSSRTLNTPSGWTLRQSVNTDAHICACYTKTADSGDVSASDFTFTISSTADVYSGAIVSATNVASGSEIGGSEVDSGTTFSFTTAIAATTADSLAMMMFTGAQNNSSGGTVSAYASTPTLTWTERADSPGNNSSPAMSFAVATAPNTGTSNITNRSATLSVTPTTTRGIMIILNGLINASTTLDAITINATTQAQTPSGDANVTTDTVSISAATQDPTAATPSEKWANTAKSAESTFTNTSKS